MELEAHPKNRLALRIIFTNKYFLNPNQQPKFSVMKKLLILLSLVLSLTVVSLNAEKPSLESVYGKDFDTDIRNFAAQLGMAIQYFETEKHQFPGSEDQIREFKALLDYTKAEITKSCHYYNCFPNHYPDEIIYQFSAGKAAVTRVVIPLYSDEHREIFMKERIEGIKSFLVKYKSFFEAPSSHNSSVKELLTLIDPQSRSHPFSKLLTELGI